MNLNYPFSSADMIAASDEWGCNCGPTALAFALQLPIKAVRYAIPQFEERRYTNPTMMKAALAFFKRGYSVVRPPKYIKGTPNDVEPMFHDAPSLVRVQWTGPWTEPGASPKWAYRQTHWIATWRERGVPLVFDCNSGITGISWIESVVPQLTKLYPRADGEWFPTHIWRLNT